LGTAITEGLKDPRIGFVTVTAVETSPDLRNATVYLSVFGSAAERTDTLEGLEESRVLLQGRIASELHLKNTPRLSFSHDDSVDRGIRMSALIDQVAADLPDPTEEDDE